jgi:orotate phosphoribosyltransferase
MHAYQQQFIELSLRYQALRFGSFTLKSGRQSPYFFNAGQFQTGRALAELGRCYAAALMASGLEFDMLFGPAYKGIPLVSAVAIALTENFDRDVPYSFNRKEIKSHGEGGALVGAPLKGRIVIVDDVITAGTAIGDVMQLFATQPHAQACAVLIGLDRQERGSGSVSAAQGVSDRYHIPVLSVLQVEDLIRYLETQAESENTLEAIRAYRALYVC